MISRHGGAKRVPIFGDDTSSKNSQVKPLRFSFTFCSYLLIISKYPKLRVETERQNNYISTHPGGFV